MDAAWRHTDSRLKAVREFDYGSVEYWDQRYEKQRKEHGLDFAYEWYCDLETVESHLAMVVLEYKMPRILIVGCGNSRLGEMIYKNGYVDVSNLDFSAVVIGDMKKRHKYMEGMQFFIANVMSMHMFPVNSFDIIIDKGCIDSIFCVGDGARNAIKAYKEVHRLLAPKGRFLSYSASGPAARKLHMSAEGLQWVVESTFVGSLAGCYYYECQMPKYKRKPPKRKPLPPPPPDPLALDDEPASGAGGGAGAGAGAGGNDDVDLDPKALELEKRRKAAARKKAAIAARGSTKPPKRGVIEAHGTDAIKFDI